MRIILLLQLFGIILTLFVTRNVMFESAETYNKLSVPLAPKDPHTCLIQVTKPVEHGEGPHWDDRNKRLYFVDSYVGRVHSLESISGEVHTMQFQGDTPAVFTVIKHTNIFIVANNRTLLGVKWSGRTDDGYKRTVLAEVEIDKPTNRFNDGKVDRHGRLWIGTMGAEESPGVAGVKPNQGNVYRVNQSETSKTKLNLKPEVMIPRVTISNGIAWNSNNTIMYYIDTSSLKVMAYDFNLQTGTLDVAKARVVFDFTKQNKFTGAPDGMTIDRDNNLWVALYGGGCVVHINPRSSNLIRYIAIPSRYVTSVIFGGIELDTLYVTTSRRALTDDERKWQPSAGAVFAIKGIPAGIVGSHTNIISAEALGKINCKDDNNDLWCQPNVKLS